ncbi:MAG TPA: type II toxin-antitoxin system prevent-host-death family antitoxin [Thermoleophilaceae bacterium]|nr:type II toxin-antitoxin system prevent-host-death family antitoxin [Thermoleophilaceae bacterium]
MTLHALKSEVGVRELHNQLSRYVNHVAAGQEVVVTMRGKPVARLAPIDAPDPLADLRRRGLVQEPTADWQPRPLKDRPRPTKPVAPLVSEQRG